MMQFFGPALFLGVANNLFNSKLISYIEALYIPDLNVYELVQGGATTLRHLVPKQYLPSVIEAYMKALQWPFRISLILACLSIFAVIGMEWKQIKGSGKKEEFNSNEAMPTME